MASLSRFPNEVIVLIANNVAPGDLVNFASSCHSIFECCWKALEIHRQRVKKLYYVHDINPLGIPNVLRDIIREPPIAWYIRKMVIWTCRTTFSQWISPYYLHSEEGSRRGEKEEILDFEDSDDEALYTEYVEYDKKNPARVRYQPVSVWPDDDSFFDENEIAVLYEFMLNTLLLSEDSAKTWVRAIELGNQEQMQCLVAAYATMLQTYVLVSTNYERYTSEKAAHCICWAIRENITNQPPGGPLTSIFPSLRHVSIGQVTNRRHPHESFLYGPMTVLPFIALPNIEELDLNSPGSGGRDDPAETWLKPQFKSSIQSLKIKGSRNFPDETIARIIKVSKSLKTYSESTYIPGGRSRIGEVLRQYAFESLEHLHIPYKSMQLHDFKRLKTVTMSYSDLTQPHVDDERRSATLTFCSLTEFMPNTLTKLQIRGRNLNPQSVHNFCQMLTTFMKGKRQHHPQLRGICLKPLTVRRLIESEEDRRNMKPIYAIAGPNIRSCTERLKLSAELEQVALEESVVVAKQSRSWNSRADRTHCEVCGQYKGLTNADVHDNPCSA